MLVLTRSKTEAVQIGEDVRVVVLGVQGGQVRLGIEAPQDVAVHREEIYQQIKSERDSWR